MEELLKQIGLNKRGSISKTGSYIIEIDNFEEYVKFYNLLDKSPLLDELEDNSQVTEHATNVTYRTDEFLINLLGDLDNDTYKLVCNRI